MTTHVLDPESVATQIQRRAASRDPFFAVVSAALLLIVLSGFAPTLYLRPVFNPPAMPWYLFLHGIVLTSWFCWLFVQTLLIRSRRTALHRRLGVLGAVLATAVPFAGLMATAGVPGRIVGAGINLDADASVLVGLGLSGLSVVQFLSNVAWGNLASATSFAVLAWTGIVLAITAHARDGRGARRCYRVPALDAIRVWGFTLIAAHTLGQGRRRGPGSLCERKQSHFERLFSAIPVLLSAERRESRDHEAEIFGFGFWVSSRPGLWVMGEWVDQSGCWIDV